MFCIQSFPIGCLNVFFYLLDLILFPCVSIDRVRNHREQVVHTWPFQGNYPSLQVCRHCRPHYHNRELIRGARWAITLNVQLAPRPSFNRNSHAVRGGGGVGITVDVSVHMLCTHTDCRGPPESLPVGSIYKQLPTNYAHRTLRVCQDVECSCRSNTSLQRSGNHPQSNYRYLHIVRGGYSISLEFDIMWLSTLMHLKKEE